MTLIVGFGLVVGGVVGVTSFVWLVACVFCIDCLVVSVIYNLRVVSVVCYAVVVYSWVACWVFWVGFGLWCCAVVYVVILLLNDHCSLMVWLIAVLLICLFVVVLDSSFEFVHLGLCLTFVFEFWLIRLTTL